MGTFIHSKPLSKLLMKVKAFEALQEPPLPAENVTQCLPFERTGIDYCGPYRIKLYSESMKVNGINFSGFHAVRSLLIRLLKMIYPETSKPYQNPYPLRIVKS